MSPARHMVRLLAVMIVTIVAGFGVSAAQAHERQGVQPRGVQAQEARFQGAQVHEHRAHGHRHAATIDADAPGAVVVDRVQPPGLRAEAGVPDACVLCCLTCTACCHSGLMPAAAGELPSPVRPVRIAVAQVPMPPGLAPEALPKPPRSFA